MVCGIGIDTDPGDLDGDLGRLEARLERFVALGFDSVELTIAGTNVIRGGSINEREMDSLLHVTGRYRLQYSCHAPNSLNVAASRNLDTHIKAFVACLEVCQRVGAHVLVYHSGQTTLEHPRLEFGGLPTPSDLERRWQAETARLREMAQVAGELGVTIAVENRDPHLSDLMMLAQFGVPESELVTYHQGTRLDLLAQQLTAIDSPHVGLTLDVGHAFLAAPFWRGTSFLAAIEGCAPWVRHVHLHDNFGQLDDVAETDWERLTLGEADNHMPPGWGRIPLAEVLLILHHAGYDGLLSMEFCPRYQHYAGEALATVRATVAALMPSRAEA